MLFFNQGFHGLCDGPGYHCHDSMVVAIAPDAHVGIIYWTLAGSS